MLNEGAPGWTWEAKLHGRSVKAGGRTYPTLPKYDEIEIGHVRKWLGTSASSNARRATALPSRVYDVDG